MSDAASALPWHVLGAGAIGGLWALRLARAGVPVTLIAPGTPAATRTLTCRDGNSEFMHRFAQVPTHAAGPIDRLLVTTKSNRTTAALTPLLPQLAPQTLVLLLQNGMGADEWLMQQRSDLCVLTGITTDGVFRPQPDLLVLAGKGETLLGASRAADAETGRALANELGRTGWSVQYVTDIKTRRWQKLAMNCAINPLTARYRCRNGELLENPEALALMRTLCDEIAQVMQAEGMPAGGEALFRLACTAAEKTAANLSSMRADVDAGRDTEIRFLNGYVVQRAHAHGIAVPANAALEAEVLRLTPH